MLNFFVRGGLLLLYCADSRKVVNIYHMHVSPYACIFICINVHKQRHRNVTLPHNFTICCYFIFSDEASPWFVLNADNELC